MLDPTELEPRQPETLFRQHPAFARAAELAEQMSGELFDDPDSAREYGFDAVHELDASIEPDLFDEPVTFSGPDLTTVIPHFDPETGATVPQTLPLRSIPLEPGDDESTSAELQEPMISGRFFGFSVVTPRVNLGTEENPCDFYYPKLVVLTRVDHSATTVAPGSLTAFAPVNTTTITFDHDTEVEQSHAAMDAIDSLSIRGLSEVCANFRIVRSDTGDHDVEELARSISQIEASIAAIPDIFVRERAKDLVSTLVAARLQISDRTSFRIETEKNAGIVQDTATREVQLDTLALTSLRAIVQFGPHQPDSGSSPETETDTPDTKLCLAVAVTPDDLYFHDSLPIPKDIDDTELVDDDENFDDPTQIKIKHIVFMPLGALVELQRVDV